MSAPKRIQRKRTKGWRMPEDAVYVGRPTQFGNVFVPVKVDGRWMVVDENGMDYEPYSDTRLSAVKRAVGLYADLLTYWFGGWMELRPDFAEAVRDLAGKDLACWCPLDQPCHADVLLEIANEDGR